MRGRRGHSSSAVSQKQTRMSLRRQVINDVGDIPSGDQQEDEDLDDRDDNEELSSSLLSPLPSRQKHRQERENKSGPKEMTEEEMMDLALRLSEQEASITALRLQKEEEEDMMKAIQESMINQTQPCPPSQSQSLFADTEASLRICSRRKLLYSNEKPASASDQGALENSCTTDTELNQGAKRSGDENKRNKKRKRKEGSPLLEMPDLSQTQKIYSQASPGGSEVLDLPLDSPQSSDSTQIDDCQLRKSPIFPSTGCRAQVHIPRLSHDLLQTCRTSGFVWCSQDSWTSPLKSLPAQPKSPTFPKSPKPTSDLTSRKSPVFSATDQGDDGEAEPSPEYCRSPVFGRNTQHEKSPRPCKPQVSVCNSGFTFSSQESLTSSVRSMSCHPQSPVFPRSPNPPKSHPPPKRSATSKSQVPSETDGGQTERSLVFGRAGRPRKICLNVQKHSASASAAELRGPRREEDSATTEGPSQSLRQDSQTDEDQLVRLNESSNSGRAEKELEVTSKDQDSEEMDLTSNMTLRWSDEDVTTRHGKCIAASLQLKTTTHLVFANGNDVRGYLDIERGSEIRSQVVTQDAFGDTFCCQPVGSPSPVFPEERPVHLADGQPASLNHRTAASPEPTGSNCSPSSSSSTSRQQRSTTERLPISRQGMVSGAGDPAACGSTVHYYWGVPFCPRGLDPDSYTQVILAQMEVYEKSLKQAQRCLLRKAEWGEAILPQPEKSPSSESPAESPQELFPRRRRLRLRSKKPSDTADTPLAEAMEEEEDNKGEGDERESKEEEKRNEGEVEEQVDTDDCEVCPETQLSDNDDDGTKDLIMVTDAGAELPSKSPELPGVKMILQDDSPAVVELQEEEIEVDAPVDRKMEGNIPGRSSQLGGQHVNEEEVEEERADPEVEETKAPGLQRSTSPELEPAIDPEIPENSVDCPICQGSFPVTEIEMHAAYCDGEVAVTDKRRPKADSFQVSLKPRRKRTRRAEVADEETNDSSTPARNQEKCYICQTAVPLRDYSSHTELCIKQQESKSGAKENLLSALEKTESRDSEARPSGSKLQPGDVIDLRNDDDDEEDEDKGSVSAIRISNSPIRSFTPISEATNCLIDFRKPHRSKKLSQRRR